MHPEFEPCEFAAAEIDVVHDQAAHAADHGTLRSIGRLRGVEGCEGGAIKVGHGQTRDRAVALVRTTARTQVDLIDRRAGREGLLRREVKIQLVQHERLPERDGSDGVFLFHAPVIDGERQAAHDRHIEHDAGAPIFGGLRCEGVATATERASGRVGIGEGAGDITAIGISCRADAKHRSRVRHDQIRSAERLIVRSPQL